MPDISSLTGKMAKADEAAFRAFYELYFDRLLRYLLVLTRNEESAREALQVTMLKVAKYAKRFDTEEAFWSWLTLLARTSVVDEERKRKRYLSFLDRFFIHRNVEMEPGSENCGEEIMNLLDEGLAHLDNEERDVLESKYLRGESVRCIAIKLSSSEKAVESRLTRARRKLRDLILPKLKNEQ